MQYGFSLGRLGIETADGEMQIYDSIDEVPEPLRSRLLAAPGARDVVSPTPTITITGAEGTASYQRYADIPTEHREAVARLLSGSMGKGPARTPQVEHRITFDGRVYSSVDELPEPARSRFAALLDDAADEFPL